MTTAYSVHARRASASSFSAAASTVQPRAAEVLAEGEADGGFVVDDQEPSRFAVHRFAPQQNPCHVAAGVVVLPNGILRLIP